MTRRILLGTLALVTAAMTTVGAQGTQASPAAPKLTTFRIDVMLTRFEGTKEVGKSPFSLLANSPGNGRATLRIGVDVPSGTISNPSGSGRTETAFKTIGTQIDCTVSPFDEGRFAVDVSISDTAVFSADGGNDSPTVKRASLRLESAMIELQRLNGMMEKGLTAKPAVDQQKLKVQEAQIAVDEAKRSSIASRADLMAFRTFSASNRLYLRDGQTQQMTVATDKTSGETLKADVTLTVVK